METDFTKSVECYKLMDLESLTRLRNAFESDLGRFTPLAKAHRDEFCIARINVLNSLIQEEILEERG